MVSEALIKNPDGQHVTAYTDNTCAPSGDTPHAALLRLNSLQLSTGLGMPYAEEVNNAQMNVKK
jgi:hypothetical protein